MITAWHRCRALASAGAFRCALIWKGEVKVQSARGGQAVVLPRGMIVAVIVPLLHRSRVWGRSGVVAVPRRALVAAMRRGAAPPLMCVLVPAPMLVVLDLVHQIALRRLKSGSTEGGHGGGGGAGGRCNQQGGREGNQCLHAVPPGKTHLGPSAC